MERHLQEVRLAPLSPDRLAAVLDPEARERFEAALEQAARLLEGRIIWNVNSTAAGGGVAEILRSFLSYARGSGVNVRWTVISGPPEFFRLTKRIHNFLHGEPGDGGSLGEEEAALYREVTAENAEELAETVRPDDIVVLHDPQTAGLTHRLRETKATVIWRSHVGAEERNALVDRAWEFLAPFVEAADACVFSRRAYVPPWASNVRTEIIQPSIDPFSPKNEELAPEAVQAILSHVGLVVAPTAGGATPSYTRQDGTPGRVDRMCELLSTGPPPSYDAPLVVQVSRWDRLKDPIGVMMGFADRPKDSSEAHLVNWSSAAFETQ